jgi:DNA-binding response OmpR family regulator
MSRLLIVDDDPVCSELLARFLKHDGHDVRFTQNGAEAITLAAAFEPEVLIADWLLKDEYDGIDVARALHAAMPSMGIIFMTGLPASEVAGKLQGLPVIEVLEKPLEVDGLLQRVRVLLPPAAGPEGAGPEPRVQPGASPPPG